MCGHKGGELEQICPKFKNSQILENQNAVDWVDVDGVKYLSTIHDKSSANQKQVSLRLDKVSGLFGK